MLHLSSPTLTEHGQPAFHRWPLVGGQQDLATPMGNEMSSMDTIFAPLLEDEAACKRAGTCPRLKVRELYFEPNSGTIEIWRREKGFFRNGIDRRVVFVCESPSDRVPRDGPAHFTAGGMRGWRCWYLTAQDHRFMEARVRHGFENCLITNAVKCGVLRPSTPARLTEEEARECSGFLTREIDAVRPVVLACMGGSAHSLVVKHLLPRLNFSPLPLRLTHYSARGRLVDLFARWDREFSQVREALRASGIPDDRPVWLQ